MKMNRHLNAFCCLSSQYLLDILPEQIKQLDYVLIFRGEPEIKLMKLHKDIDLAIEFETFMKLYHDATKEKYNFLYIDVRNEKFRKNFNKEYQIN